MRQGSLTPSQGWFSRVAQYLWEKRFALLRLFIIAVLLVAAGVAGFVSTREGSLPLFALAASLIGLGAIIFYRDGNFDNGILVIAFTAGLLNFYTLPTGTQSRIVISLLVSMGLIGLWLLQLLNDPAVRLKSSPVNAPILSFVFVSLLSYVWSTLLRDPLVEVWPSFPMVQLAALAVNILLPLLALMVANKVEDVRVLKRLTWIVLAIGAVVIIWNLNNWPYKNFYYNGSRGLFGTWVAVLALAMALFNHDLRWWARASLLALTGAWMKFTFVNETVWLSGWLPIFVATLAVTFFRSRKLFLVVLVLGAGYFALNYDTYYQRIYVANIEEGSDQRVQLWQTNFDLVRRHPILGVGPAGYAVYYMSYNPQDARSTHNNYFDILAQTGSVGMAVFMWTIGTFMLIAYRALRKLRHKRNFEEGFANAVLAGSFGVLVAMMLGDWVLPFAYNQTITGFDNASYTWLMFGGVAALYYLLPNSKGEHH